MKIVFQHSGILPVKKYGGIERIMFWHMLELVNRGHQVVLFGEPGSDVERHGIELIPNPRPLEGWEAMIPKDADIIHLTYNYEPKTATPALINIQGNGQPGEKFPLNTVFVSQKHAANHGSESYIYNALDLREYPYEDRKFSLEKLLFLAKGSWKVKNLKDCLWLARKSKKPLHIAGGSSWLPSRYIKSHGMVGGEEKLSILNNTDALLFPVRWHEPFGIAIIEAMAMGSPVFGSPYGSLPELINDDVGRISSCREELLENLLNPPQFNRKLIRNYVEKNFSIQELTSQYLKTYDRILSGEVLHKEPPCWVGEQPPLTLLPFRKD